VANEEGFVSPGSRDVGFVETRARVLTWNIWWRFGPYGQRVPLILETLRQCDADVICLQEVWDTDTANQAAELAGALGLHFCYEPVLPIEGVNWGMAILSKWPVLESEGLVLPSMPSDDGSRDCKVMRARLDGPNGVVDVYNTHLSWRPEESAIRQEQVGFIANLVKQTWKGPVPPIICGDFNAIPTADEIRMLTGEAPVPVDGLYFFDAWQAAGHSDPGFTWDNANPLTNKALQPNRRLDYIFVGEPAENAAGHVLSAERVGTNPTDGVFPSDHFGVLAELRY
jgi:endonuclease/exonuclease/phosphatase family metal-dependent hydrolase